MKPKKTFVVISRQGGELHASVKPFEHSMKSNAVLEAERLAQFHVGVSFTVFEAVCVSHVEPKPSITQAL